ncbi:MAG: alpha/beta fold hydrolase [Lautropia sp.]|nr:alpha/beta fold hydrolase [Lautropia sp.]
MQEGWIDCPHCELMLGDFRLESGETIRDFRLSYVVHGAEALAAAGALQGAGNVVLALSAVASSHHRLDFLIGTGRAFDPVDTIVVAVDAIGNGLTTSPSNSTLQPGLAFPAFSIRDMVASQLALLDYLGVDRLKAVAGASMGGMQALQWAVSQPARVERVVAMTPMARTTAWAAAINETSRRALLADLRALAAGAADGADGADGADAADGAVNSAWSAWVPLMQLISGRTPQQVDRQFAGPAEVHEWIRHRTQWWEQQRFAPVDWLYQSQAYDAHDVGTTPGFNGDTERALRSVTLPILVLAPALDLYNPAAAAREAAERMPGARFVEIPSEWGHQSASPADAAAAAFLNWEIGRFLRKD